MLSGESVGVENKLEISHEDYLSGRLCLLCSGILFAVDSDDTVHVLGPFSILLHENKVRKHRPYSISADLLGSIFTPISQQTH